MPAPPSSFTATFFALAASATRSASSIVSSSGRPFEFNLRPARARVSLGRDLDHDRLEVRHLLQGEAPADAPDSALLARAAAERKVGLPVVGRLVDVDPACLECIGEAERSREVFRVDGSQQPMASRWPARAPASRRET